MKYTIKEIQDKIYGVGKYYIYSHFAGLIGIVLNFQKKHHNKIRELSQTYTTAILFLTLFKLYLLYHLNVVIGFKISVFILITLFSISYYFCWANLLKEILVILATAVLPYRILLRRMEDLRTWIAAGYWDEISIKFAKPESFFKEIFRLILIFLTFIRLIILMEPFLFTIVNLFVIQTLLLYNTEVRLWLSLVIILSRILFFFGEPGLKMLKIILSNYNNQFNLPYIQLYPNFRNANIVMLWLTTNFLRKLEKFLEYAENKPHDIRAFLKWGAEGVPLECGHFRPSLVPFYYLEDYPSSYTQDCFKMKLEDEYNMQTMYNCKQPELLNPVNSETEIYSQLKTYESKILKFIYVYIIPQKEEKEEIQEKFDYSIFFDEKWDSVASKRSTKKP